MPNTSQITDSPATAHVRADHAHADPHDSSNNKPLKEIGTALIGIVLLLVVILLIAISAWLRPAGDHISPETGEVAVEQTAVAETGTDVATDTQAPADGTVNAE